MAKDIRDLADEEVMQLVQGGNPRAFELLYDRHGGAAFSLAYRMVGNRGAAETSSKRRSCRSGAVAALRPGTGKRPHLGARHRPQPGDRRTAAKRRARSPARDDRGSRSARRHPSARTWRSRREARSIRNALDTLPDEQRKTIELAYFGGFSHSQIAELLNEPVGTVKGRMRLGLDKMRRQLSEGYAAGDSHDGQRSHELSDRRYLLGA